MRTVAARAVLEVSTLAGSDGLYPVATAHRGPLHQAYSLRQCPADDGRAVRLGGVTLLARRPAASIPFRGSKAQRLAYRKGDQDLH